MSLDGTLLEANWASLAAVGVSREAVVGKPFWETTWWTHDPAQQKRLRAAVPRAASGEQVRFEATHPARDGSLMWVDFSLTPFRDEQGDVVLLIPEGRDITRRKLAEEALREKEAKLAAQETLLRQFIKHAPVAIAMFDRELRYLQMSDRWLVDYHLTGTDLVGRSHYEAFPHLPEHWKAVHQRVLAGAVEKSEEDCFPRADGSIEWLQWECRPWREAGGEVGGLIMFTQVITGRKLAAERLKASLQEKEVLLKEIHHRVKNNLQIVSTLLDLQSDQTTDPEARAMFQESQGRVRSMALIHERLYRSQDMARVDFRDYVHQLAADLHRSYRVPSSEIQLVLDVSVAPLPIDMAIPCALMLNELLANSFKHAFVNRSSGCIRVSFREQGEANVLIVSDNGQGFPAGTDFRNTSSLGLQLVNTLVAQLDGTIELHSAEGTKFTIRFPRTQDPTPGLSSDEHLYSNC